MNVDQLKNKIGFQIGFLEFSGKTEEQTIEDIMQLAVDYAEQFKYDFSKNCKCDSRIGETWCCNQCGLPTSFNTKFIKAAPDMFQELVKIFENYDKGTDTYKRLEKIIKSVTP